MACSCLVGTLKTSRKVNGYRADYALVMAYKMPGAGGGGYLACVVEDAEKFCKEHEEAIPLTIRRAGF